MSERLLLCAYNAIGIDVLNRALTDTRISDLAVLTHQPRMGAPDLRAASSEAEVWWSTEHVNRVELPFEPTVLATVYYRYIVSAEVINSVSGRAFNVHPSLLPRHRGCSSIPWAIIEGDHETGVTFHYLDPEIDTGLIILQRPLSIGDDETQKSLYGRAMKLGARLWPEALDLVLSANPGWPQVGTPSYHHRGAPFDGEINDQWPLDQIERFIRAMSFPPYPYATYRGEEIRCLDDYLRLGPTSATATDQA